MKKALTHLDARFAQIHTQTVGILAVVFDQFLQCPECGSPGNEEASLVQLSDPVVFHRIAISYCREEKKAEII